MASVPAAESESFLDGASAASSSSSDGDASIAGAPLPSSNSRVQISKLLSECSADDLRHPAVVHAVQVNSALYHRDFYRFFQLWDAAPNMGVCIMAACVPAMRQHAARCAMEFSKTLLLSFTPLLHLTYLTAAFMLTSHAVSLPSRFVTNRHWNACARFSALKMIRCANHFHNLFFISHAHTPAHFSSPLCPHPTDCRTGHLSASLISPRRRRHEAPLHPPYQICWFRPTTHRLLLLLLLIASPNPALQSNLRSEKQIHESQGRFQSRINTCIIHCLHCLYKLQIEFVSGGILCVDEEAVQVPQFTHDASAHPSSGSIGLSSRVHSRLSKSRLPCACWCSSPLPTSSLSSLLPPDALRVWRAQSAATVRCARVRTRGARRPLPWPQRRDRAWRRDAPARGRKARVWRVRWRRAARATRVAATIVRRTPRRLRRHCRRRHVHQCDHHQRLSRVLRI